MESTNRKSTLLCVSELTQLVLPTMCFQNLMGTSVRVHYQLVDRAGEVDLDSGNTLAELIDVIKIKEGIPVRLSSRACLRVQNTCQIDLHTISYPLVPQPGTLSLSLSQLGLVDYLVGTRTIYVSQRVMTSVVDILTCPSKRRKRQSQA